MKENISTQNTQEAMSPTNLDPKSKPKSKSKQSKQSKPTAGGRRNFSWYYNLLKSRRDQKKVVNVEADAVTSAGIHYGKWLQNHKVNVRKYLSGKKPDRKVTEEQIDLMKAIGVDYGEIDNKDEAEAKNKVEVREFKGEFWEKYGDLCIFIEKNDHCNLPDGHDLKPFLNKCNAMNKKGSLPRVYRQMLCKAKVPLVSRSFTKGFGAYCQLPTGTVIDENHKLYKWYEQTRELFEVGALSEQEKAMLKVVGINFTNNDVSFDDGNDVGSDDGNDGGNDDGNDDHNNDCDFNVTLNRQVSDVNSSGDEEEMNKKTPNPEQTPANKKSLSDTNDVQGELGDKDPTTAYGTQHNVSQAPMEGQGKEDELGPPVPLEHSDKDPTTACGTEHNVSQAPMEVQGKLPTLEAVSAGVYPTTTCSFCDSGSRGIFTNHYCTMESNNPLFWKEGNQICGKTTCVECKEKKDIESLNRCATCFFAVTDEELTKMKVTDLRALAHKLDYGEKTKKKTMPNKKSCVAFIRAEFNL